MKKYDVIVTWSGEDGIETAIKMALDNKKVAIIDEENFGGEFLNYSENLLDEILSLSKEWGSFESVFWRTRLRRQKAKNIYIEKFEALDIDIITSTFEIDWNNIKTPTETFEALEIINTKFKENIISTPEWIPKDKILDNKTIFDTTKKFWSLLIIWESSFSKKLYESMKNLKIETKIVPSTKDLWDISNFEKVFIER